MGKIMLIKMTLGYQKLVEPLLFYCYAGWIHVQH